jgi:4-amino-4-deoxy-L-arabinose transferase-like glycosyltransferase
VNAAAGWLSARVPVLTGGAPRELHELLSIAMGSTFTFDPDAVMLFRSLALGSGVLSVALVFLLGKRGHSVAVGLVAAALTAVSPLLITDCRYVTPDSYVVLFGQLTALAALSVARTGSRWSYVAAGAAVGAAAASKYNAALVCLYVIAAHCLHFGLTPRGGLRLIGAGLVSVLVFLLCSPFVLLDYATFAADASTDFAHYSKMHQGMEGHAPTWYTQQLWAGTGIAVILAVAEIARGVRRRDALPIILAAFAVPYFLFICSFHVRNSRTLAPLVPSVLLLASIFLIEGVVPRLVAATTSIGLRRALLCVCGLALIFVPLRVTVDQARALTTVDSRTTAREWIDAELPEHATIAVESYAPFVNPARFRIVQSERAINHAPSWYPEHGVDYIVLSQGTFGRYFADPQTYPFEVLRYVQLTRSATLVRRFADGGYEIDVYKTNPVNSDG